MLKQVYIVIIGIINYLDTFEQKKSQYQHPLKVVSKAVIVINLIYIIFFFDNISLIEIYYVI